jgi:hypothetical protein
VLEKRVVYISLRAATEQAPQPQRDAMVGMARMLGSGVLGPDCLAEVDGMLGKHYDMEERIAVFTKRGWSRSEAMARVRIMDTPPRSSPTTSRKNLWPNSSSPQRP